AEAQGSGTPRGLASLTIDDKPVTAGEGAPPPSRAGRNLPVAIAVGVGLGLLVLLTIYLYKPAFVVVIIVAISIGIYELARSLGAAGIAAPVAPILVGAVAMEITAYRRGPEELVVALLLTVVAVAVWRLLDGAEGYLRDVAAGAFIAVYVPFLAGFAALIL